MDIKKEICGQADKGVKESEAFVKTALRWIIFAAAGFALGRVSLPFGASPFGFALISASKGATIPALIGVILSGTGGASVYLYASVSAAVVVARVLVCVFSELHELSARRVGERFEYFRAHLFGEPTALCALTAAIGAFSFSLYYVVTSDFLLYYVYSAIINTLVAALCVVAWRSFLLENEKNAPFIFYKKKNASNKSKKMEVGEVFSLIALVSFCAAIVLGTKGFSPFGVSLSALLAAIFTFSAVKYRSLAHGALIGALCGLAIDPLIVPSFVFGAVVFAFFTPISVFLGMLGAFAVGMWWGFYSIGLRSLTLLLPALLAAALFFTVIDALVIGSEKERSASDKSIKAAQKSQVGERKITAELLKMQNRLSVDAFGRLSERFGALSDELGSISSSYEDEIREGRDLYGICEGAFDSACSSCDRRQECRADCEFSEELGIIGGELKRGEMAQSSSVSEKLRNRCARLPDIIDEINYNASMRSALWRDHERTQSVALDYRMISSLISRCGAISEEENTIDAEGGAALSLRVSELLELDCAAAIFGKRQRRALLSFDISAKEKAESDEVQKKLCAVLCDFLGGEAVLIDTRVKDDTLSLTYGRAAKISVSFDARSVNAFGEDEYCGDSYGICSDEESCRTLAFISDGMGCGREASEVSRTVASFLKNILPLSYDCDHTVKMLNAFLRRRGGDSIRECSATVDLANIDLMASRASFYKSGAAPTYVLRGDSVFKIRARSIPVGIISEVDIQKTDLELYPSDIIVMISDGVTQGKEECPRLFELLKSTRSTDPRRISELVVKYALDSGGKDDISVLVLRVDPR